jgi:Fe-coproporphyrin III synthase
MGPTGTSRILQIHPTRQCNLSCLHCYSSSSPRERDRLPVALLLDAVSAAADEDYTMVSLSGGEPLLYEPLPDLLRHARHLGLRTTVTSNGTLLNESRLRELRDLVDVLAISLDGEPSSHDRMRGSSSAFKRLQDNLPAVRDSGIPFGFIFTLTQHNLDELDWVANFAVALGASLLQIHPLESVGNAETQLADKTPDAKESAYAWLLGRRIQERLGDRLQVQVDIALSLTIKQDPARVYAGPESNDTNRPFGQLLSPLVIEADGSVVPIQYGFPRRYALGNIHTMQLTQMFTTWRSQGLRDFRGLCAGVYSEVLAAREPYFLNWYDRLQQHAVAASLHASTMPVKCVNVS